MDDSYKRAPSGVVIAQEIWVKVVLFTTQNGEQGTHSALGVVPPSQSECATLFWKHSSPSVIGKKRKMTVLKTIEVK